MQSSTITSGPAAAAVQGKRRFGCFAQRIGSIAEIKLTAPITLTSGRLMAAGQKMHVSLQDITRHPDVEQHAHWICQHPECRDKKWPSKKALVAEHKPNRELEKLEESHCYYAIAYLPGVEAKPEKRGKHGEIVEPAVEPKMPSVMALSDEE